MKNSTTVTLSNPNATDVEKSLFNICGLYLIEEDEWTLIYAPVHVGKHDLFPCEIKDVEKELIEYDSIVVFDKMSEMIKVKKYYDIDIMTFLVQRMEELGFKRCLTNPLEKPVFVQNSTKEKLKGKRIIEGLKEIHKECYGSGWINREIKPYKRMSYRILKYLQQLPNLENLNVSDIEEILESMKSNIPEEFKDIHPEDEFVIEVTNCIRWLGRLT